MSEERYDSLFDADNRDSGDEHQELNPRPRRTQERYVTHRADGYHVPLIPEAVALIGYEAVKVNVLDHVALQIHGSLMERGADVRRN